MTQHLAFFPWIHVEAPTPVGHIELRPYEHTDHAISREHHRIVGAYRDGSGHSVRQSTLIAVRGQLGGALGDVDIVDLFHLRDLLSFVGLLERRFFALVPPYVNDHSFQLVVQGYEAGKDGALIEARRRDGTQKNIIDGSVFCERHGHHVSANVTPRLDFDLLRVLCKCLRDDPASFEWLTDSIELFCLANTDSSAIRPYTELILTSSALQRAMGVSKKSKAKQLAEVFASTLDRVVPPQADLADTKKALTPAQLGGGLGLRALWFEDFYKARGVLAHGQTSPKAPLHWSVREHLLLSSHIVPLVVLARLDELGVRSLAEDDLARIAGFDALLCLPDAFARDPGRFRGDEQWLWTEALFEASRRYQLSKLTQQLAESADAKEGSP